MVDDGGPHSKPHSLYCPPACMCVVMAVQQQGPDTGEINLNNDEEKRKIKTRQQRELGRRGTSASRELQAGGSLMLGA